MDQRSRIDDNEAQSNIVSKPNRALTSLLLLSNGEMIMLLGAIGLICTCIPLFLGWDYNYEEIESSSAIVHQSIKSREFGYSVVSCIAVLIPLLIELLCDMIPFSWKKLDHNKFLRGILILCQLIPGLLILLVAIPYNSPSILVIAFQSRNITGFCAAFAKISETGCPVFQAKSIILLTMTVIISCLCSTYSSFITNAAATNVVNILNSICGIVTILCYGFQTIRWIYRIRSKDYKDITIDELECTLYLLAIFLISCGIIVINLKYGSDLDPNTSSRYLTTYNYLLAAFSVSLILIQGRIVHKEKDIVQQCLETKRLFVRYVSHEIRTPLNTVFLGLKLLRDEIHHSESTVFETLDDIELSCDIALHILNDLLSFEKIESGLLMLEIEALRPKEWLLEAVNPYYVQARKLEIRLKLKCDSSFEGRLLFADKPKINQVIRNVLSNALKFTPRNGLITITTSLIHRSTKSMKSKQCFEKYPTTTLSHYYYLRIQIVDTGSGIEQENISKLFHQIIQFNASKLQAGGGSGLGLWISQAIVKKHHGSITAHSDGLGQGVTITIELPLTEQQQHYQPQDSSISSSSSSIRNYHHTNSNVLREYSLARNSNKTPSFPATDQRVFPIRKLSIVTRTDRTWASHWPLHVLVVDDSPLNRKMLVRLIEKKFLTVREAVDGIDAVSQMKDSFLPGNIVVDVILMDYMMPNMDGPTAAQEIRQLGYSGLIIGVTGNALQVDIDTFIGNGADKVMIKPVDVNALITVISGRFNYQF